MTTLTTTLIVGLGNPGEQYANNRHNYGFRVLDALVTAWSLPPFAENRRLQSMLTAKTQAPRAWLCKPSTFMNESGEAVSAVSRFYTIPVESIWVVHDDMDIPFGEVRIHQNLSDGGHNGIRSIIRDLHSQSFWRFRVGIGRPHSMDANADGRVDSREWAMAKYDTAEYVLADFDPMQVADLPSIIKRVSDALVLALQQSPAAAANQFNGPPKKDPSP